MKIPKDVAEALKVWGANDSTIIRMRCVADVYNENDDKHRCRRKAKENSRHCWQHDPRGSRGFLRRKA